MAGNGEPLHEGRKWIEFLVQDGFQAGLAWRTVPHKREAFDAFIRSFTDSRIIHNAWKTMDQIPVSTPLSDKVSRSLKADGFSFAGNTIYYLRLQAAGVVNDLLVHCYRYEELL